MEHLTEQLHSRLMIVIAEGDASMIKRQPGLVELLTKLTFVRELDAHTGLWKDNSKYRVPTCLGYLLNDKCEVSRQLCR
jgi:hypothetical protein